MNVLAIDVGGTNVKILASGHKQVRKIPSGRSMTAKRMVSGVQELARGWKYEVVSIGYPGPVRENRLKAEPHNLAKGWVGFDFEKAFGCPVKIINDAAMQGLGSYKQGKMLFLGLGTGLGSCLVINGRVEPLELAHLHYRKGTYEDYVGRRRLEKRGRAKWCKDVADAVAHLSNALQPDEIVLGGGNAKKLRELPKGCRLGSNANAFRGGFRMWDKAGRNQFGKTNRITMRRRSR
jgi:polyphosphate glucokinase